MEPGVPGEVWKQAAGDEGQFQARYLCVEGGNRDGWSVGNRDGWSEWREGIGMGGDHKLRYKLLMETDGAERGVGGRGMEETWGVLGLD